MMNDMNKAKKILPYGTDEENDLMNKVIDEVYSQYETDHSFEVSCYHHPMFYNGTFSENNEYKPKKPELLMTRQEFIEKLNDKDSEWLMGVQVLYIYLSREKI